MIFKRKLFFYLIGTQFCSNHVALYEDLLNGQTCTFVSCSFFLIALTRFLFYSWFCIGKTCSWAVREAAWGNEVLVAIVSQQLIRAPLLFLGICALGPSPTNALCLTLLVGDDHQWSHTCCTQSRGFARLGLCYCTCSAVFVPTGTVLLWLCPVF